MKTQFRDGKDENRRATRAVALKLICICRECGKLVFAAPKSIYILYIYIYLSILWWGGSAVCFGGGENGRKCM